MKHHITPIAAIMAIMTTALLAACTPKRIADEVREFDHDVWNRFTPELFDIKVDNNEDLFNIDFEVKVDTALFRYDYMPFVVELDSPEREHRQIFTGVELKTSGRWRGEAEGAYRVVQGRIRSLFSFNHKGVHKLSVKQDTPQYDLEGIHSFRVIVERTEIDYSAL